MNIQSHIKNIVKNGIIKYAKKYNAQHQSVNIHISIAGKGLSYFIFVNDVFKERVSFIEILDVVFDFLFQEKLMKPYLINGLAKAASLEGIPLERVAIMMGTADNEFNRYTIDLMNGSTLVKSIDSQYFKDVFKLDVEL
jgi:hypothetical protein